MKRIRTIVIDDEEEARDGISLLLSKLDQFEVLATCDNGLEAINKINQIKPDLVFLDIQMPQINGFEVLNSLESEVMPKVVFVTAYDQYALRAFEVHATDYLLKPFSDARFIETINHVNMLFQNKEDGLGQLKRVIQEYMLHSSPETHDELISTTSTSDKPPSQLIIKSGGKIIFIPLSDISHITAQNYYVQVHASKAKHLARESLKSLEKYLDTASFIRIHKSTLVNSLFISEVEPYFNGELILKLRNGEKLKVSRHYRKNLPKIFG